MTAAPNFYSCTPLMEHQKRARAAMLGREEFALLMEQGTGKTLAFLDEGFELFALGKIDAIFVLAPNGVHENWIVSQLPQHAPDGLPIVAAYYAQATTRKLRAQQDALTQTMRDLNGAVQPLRVLAMSYDSLLTDHGWAFATKFARAFRCYLVADESQKIKGDTRRTLRALNLRKHAPIRRIGTGTAVTNSPVDAYYQFEFLRAGILGEDTITAFRSQYCELLPQDHGLMRHVRERIERRKGKPLTDAQAAKMLPQVVAKDDRGLPVYRNLNKLHERIAAHSFRVLKSECLDLPPKVFETRYFHLSPAQRAVYNLMEEQQRFILEDETLLTTSKLVALGKLRQITSGFMMMKDGTTTYLEDNPRIQLLHEVLEDNDQPRLIWGQYREELANVRRMIRAELKAECEVVNGETPLKRRREIMDEFQAGHLQYIAAHPETMGTGFTLTAAGCAIYYSNGFKLDDRLQSEDRCHRIGSDSAGHTSVLYLDLCAIDTRDEDVVWALQHKLDTAAIVNGDPKRKSRWGISEK